MLNEEQMRISYFNNISFIIFNLLIFKMIHNWFRRHKTGSKYIIKIGWTKETIEVAIFAEKWLNVDKNA